MEVNDRLVQGTAAAKWSLEAARLDAGLTVLNQTLSEAQKLVPELIRLSDEVDGHRSPERYPVTASADDELGTRAVVDTRPPRA